jgi:hypothetical protein
MVLRTEHCDAGEFAESVTLYEYGAVAVGEAMYVDNVADTIAVLHAPSEYHW